MYIILLITSFILINIFYIKFTPKSLIKENKHCFFSDLSKFIYLFIIVYLFCTYNIIFMEEIKIYSLAFNPGASGILDILSYKYDDITDIFTNVPSETNIGINLLQLNSDQIDMILHNLQENELVVSLHNLDEKYVFCDSYIIDSLLSQRQELVPTEDLATYFYKPGLKDQVISEKLRFLNRDIRAILDPNKKSVEALNSEQDMIKYFFDRNPSSKIIEPNLVESTSSSTSSSVSSAMESKLDPVEDIVQLDIDEVCASPVPLPTSPMSDNILDLLTDDNILELTEDDASQIIEELGLNFDSIPINNDFDNLLDDLGDQLSKDLNITTNEKK